MRLLPFLLLLLLCLVSAQVPTPTAKPYVRPAIVGVDWGRCNAFGIDPSTGRPWNCRDLEFLRFRLANGMTYGPFVLVPMTPTLTDGVIWSPQSLECPPPAK